MDQVSTPETTYYVYDAAGQRVRKVTEGFAKRGQNPRRMKERIYLGGFVIYRSYDGSGQSVVLERETLHVMDDKQRVALVETRTVGDDDSLSQTIRYQLANHLGSAILELDETARIISYEEYYPYGSTAYQASSTLTEVKIKRYRYTGKERDEETGFYYYGARYYAPWLGRWTSCDPLGIKDGINLYVYVNNRPIIAIDPIGTQTEIPDYDPETMDPIGTYGPPIPYSGPTRVSQPKLSGLSEEPKVNMVDKPKEEGILDWLHKQSTGVAFSYPANKNDVVPPTAVNDTGSTLLNIPVNLYIGLPNIFYMPVNAISELQAKIEGGARAIGFNESEIQALRLLPVGRAVGAIEGPGLFGSLRTLRTIEGAKSTVRDITKTDIGMTDAAVQWGARTYGADVGIQGSRFSFSPLDRLKYLDLLKSMDSNTFSEIMMNRSATAFATGLVNGSEVSVIATTDSRIRSGLAGLKIPGDILLPLVEKGHPHPDLIDTQYLKSIGAKVGEMASNPLTCDICQQTINQGNPGFRLLNPKWYWKKVKIVIH